MKTLESYNVIEMDTNEILHVEGGSDPDGCAGCSAGRAVREAIASFFDAWGRAAGSLNGTAGMYK